MVLEEGARLIRRHALGFRRASSRTKPWCLRPSVHVGQVVQHDPCVLRPNLVLGVKLSGLSVHPFGLGVQSFGLNVSFFCLDVCPLDLNDLICEVEVDGISGLLIQARLLVPSSLGNLRISHDLHQGIAQGLGRYLPGKIGLGTLLASGARWKGILPRGVVFAIDHHRGCAILDCFLVGLIAYPPLHRPLQHVPTMDHVKALVMQ